MYARILGFGSASEGGELRTVDESGQAAATAMSMAIHNAGLAPGDIDYVCAHGNSMVNYDLAETAAIKLAFGRQAYNLAISSIKSFCGHALGAAAAMQIVATCLVIRHGIVPPTINLENPDVTTVLDLVPKKAKKHDVNVAMSNSFGFGGTNASLILTKV